MNQRYGTYGKRPWKRHGGIGLLMLDRDRFGSLSVIDPAQPGILVSSEVAPDGPFRVWLNGAGLGPASSVRVELLDAQERPLAGLRRGRRGSGHPFWTEGSGRMEGGRARLRCA
jgi:hypothetical protein